MVKVEMQNNEAEGKLSLAFETNDESGLDVIDAIRTAIMGDHEKRCGYINSKRLIVEIKTGKQNEL
jgi:hypothetical protein